MTEPIALSLDDEPASLPLEERLAGWLEREEKASRFDLYNPTSS